MRTASIDRSDNISYVKYINGLCSFSKRSLYRGRNRIDRLSTGSAVFVVDAVALIVPMQQSSTNQIRHGTADVSAARMTKPRTHLVSNHLLCASYIGR